MSKNMVPLIFDCFEVKIKMSDGNEITVHPSDLPDALRIPLDKKCREIFEDHYEEQITKYRSGA